MMTQWLTSAANAGSTVTWLALDRGDADVHRFLSHLVASIQIAEPAVGVEAQALLTGGGSANPEDVLVSLVNDLDLLAGPTIVALDDYHVIDNGEVHDAVTFLLDNLPPRVTMAMTTRADPPLPLHRLRARGELVEVRTADLRFTPDEASAFLNGVMALGPRPRAGRRARRSDRGVGRRAPVGRPVGSVPGGRTGAAGRRRQVRRRVRR